MYNFEDVNRILAELNDTNVIEPIDEPDCHPMDYADVTGLWEEMYPEPLDANGQVWYIQGI